MSFEFLGPVYMGDTVTAEAAIVEVSERGWVVLAGRVVNADGQEVLRATIRGYPRRFDQDAEPVNCQTVSKAV